MPYKTSEKRREYYRKWRAANPGKKREYDRKWREANPEKIKEASRKWVAANLEKERERKRKWNAANPEKVKEASRKWNAANPEKIKEASRKWREANPEKKREAERKYRRDNLEKYRERKRKYVAYRRATDPNWRLIKNLRTALCNTLQGRSKSASTMKIIGCTVEELFEHLESCSTWEPWMTRENYGKGGWDVDHIIPIAKWDDNCPLQFIACWDKSNLQPLEHIANIKKGSK
tara:strand:- start:50 stop:748 length:699 start_codon:yes stop_codon:yes gene_type:complete